MDALIELALDVKAGKQPGLKSTEEFKRMSHDMPEQGNQFSFMSERFGKAITDVQMQAMSANTGNQGKGMVSLFQKIINLAGPTSAYSVSANGPEGWLTTGNGTRNPANIVLVPLAVIPAIAAGVAMPAVAGPGWHHRPRPAPRRTWEARGWQPIAAAIGRHVQRDVDARAFAGPG